MQNSSQVELWDQTQSAKSETNGYWVLWPLVLLFLFQPSIHRPMAALPLVVLAVARERGAGWAWRGRAFWIALVLFGLALIRDDLMPFWWLTPSDLRQWAGANPTVLVLPGLGGCGLIAIAFASARERGWIITSRQDRSATSVRPASNVSRNVIVSANPTIRRPDPRLRELLALQMETSARFKQLSDQHAALLKLGDKGAVDRLQPEYNQARQDYDAARDEFQRVKAQP